MRLKITDGSVDDPVSPWYGLELGRITFQTLSNQFSVIDEYNVFDLFEQTLGADGRPALIVMVVAEFSGMLADAGGFTLGAPGFALRHGTLLSGLARDIRPASESLPPILMVPDSPATPPFPIAML